MRSMTLFCGWLLFASSLHGCAGSQAIQQIRAGRLALITGNSAVAAKYFQQAAAFEGESGPTPLQENAWTYLGRAYYDLNEYSSARQALERALAQNQNDDVARLYLGLIGAREQASESSRKQIQAGLQGIFDRLEYCKNYTPAGEFWDPSGRLRAELLSLLRIFTAPQPDWAKAITQVERLMVNLENEMDAAQRDESYHRNGGGGGSGDM